jgi:hypothetical protein
LQNEKCKLRIVSDALWFFESGAAAPHSETLRLPESQAD